MNGPAYTKRAFKNYEEHGEEIPLSEMLADLLHSGESIVISFAGGSRMAEDNLPTEPLTCS